MRVTTLRPCEPLAPFVRSYTVVESDTEVTRTLVPDPGLVLGFRFAGQASVIDELGAHRLPDATLAGMRSTARTMRTAAGSGIVLATFHEGGAARFFAEPLHELFGAHVALDDLVAAGDVDRTRSRIAAAVDHRHRAQLMDEFLLSRRVARTPDRLAAAAVRAIREARGGARIADLARSLGVGQDTLEKRFRRAVGATPKQLASIVRLRHAVDGYRPTTSLTQLAVDAGYFDQSHFIRALRAVVGQSPQQFFRGGQFC